MNNGDKKELSLILIGSYILAYSIIDAVFGKLSWKNSSLGIFSFLTILISFIQNKKSKIPKEADPNEEKSF